MIKRAFREALAGHLNLADILHVYVDLAESRPLRRPRGSGTSWLTRPSVWPDQASWTGRRPGRPARR
jgi:hypothetical protein